ncbi:hypothetical protein KP509_09G010500 [Ceratopteris richardii]|uniref:Ubiquitin-like protease family profile domain-containing protein n=1 Tax=Ceratopteris richardii TaxID=49495 RepID=A0A8T2U1X5_CERRI|nr:hypothetical protein KP509_09G010500 [Ceratopteris richardii]
METDTPDLEIVRPDLNQDCTSSYPPSPPRVEKVNVRCLTIFELEEAVKRFRGHVNKISMKDNNAKLRQCLQEYENELARRQSITQSGNYSPQVILVEGHTPKNTSIAKGNIAVFDLEAEPFTPLQQLPRSSPEKSCLTVVLDCEMEEEFSPAHLQGKKVNKIEDLERSPHRFSDEICSACGENMDYERNGSGEYFYCSGCKKGPISSLAAGVMQTSETNDVRAFTGRTRNTGSSKRSLQAIGDTFDTALELSDDEELKEIPFGESSSNNRNFIKKKCLRNASKELSNVKFLYPSSSDPEAVEIRCSDLDHLAPSEFLNDTIIDFYLKYMQIDLFKGKDGLDRFHFFSCFFYKKLTSSRAQGKDWLEKLRKWTKGTNIFKKLYLFIPIHDSCHWSLVIVCFPTEVPLILHLDSMSLTAGHSSQAIFNALKSYLIAEKRYLRQDGGMEETNVDPSKAITRRKQVPLQDNEWDCGLFMLYYIQKFVDEIDVKGLDKMFGREWFKPIEASELRGAILNILESMFIKEAA